MDFCSLICKAKPLSLFVMSIPLMLALSQKIRQVHR